MWLAIALFGTIGVFSVFDGFAEDDVQAGWAAVLVLSVIVLVCPVSTPRLSAGS